MDSFFEFWGRSVFVAGATAAIILLMVNILFALGVGTDANDLRRSGRKVAFISPGGWALACLVGSFLAVALYWAIHHTNFSTIATKPAA